MFLIVLIKVLDCNTCFEAFFFFKTLLVLKIFLVLVAALVTIFVFIGNLVLKTTLILKAILVLKTIFVLKTTLKLFALPLLKLLIFSLQNRTQSFRKNRLKFFKNFLFCTLLLSVLILVGFLGSELIFVWLEDFFFEIAKVWAIKIT